MGARVREGSKIVLLEPELELLPRPPPTPSEEEEKPPPVGDIASLVYL